MSEVETLFATLRQSNAVGLGIFEMSWNVIRPSCADVLSANKSLKTVDPAQYNCPFCAASYETTLDNEVRVDPELGLVRLIASWAPMTPAGSSIPRQRAVRRLAASYGV
jgi:hypothetical protein